MTSRDTTLKGLTEEYRKIKPEIKKRLAEFRKIIKEDDEKIFSELCYCILTANANAVGLNGTIEELQKELDKFMVDYNFKRMHSGYKLKAGGFKFPGHAFYDIRERDKMIEVRQ